MVSKNIPFSTKTALILLMSAFFVKNSTFTQSISMNESCVRDSLVLFKVFVRQSWLLMKMQVLQAIRLASTSEYLQIGHKSKELKWRHRFWYDVIVRFFWYCHIFFSSLVTGPSFTSVLLLFLELWELWQFSSIKGWPEICKSEYPYWIFFKI